MGFLALASTTMAQQSIDVSSSEYQTAVLEKKIIEDLTSMIHNYDFSTAFNVAVTEEQARHAQWQSDYKPTVQELLGKL